LNEGEESGKDVDNVTSSDIRQIKLNYLQFNKRTTATAGVPNRPGAINNEYNSDPR
jgi:hypothetical protein